MKSKIVEVGSFVVVPERIALGKKVEGIIGTITNISYPSGEKDFAYVEVLFLSNETRWYRECDVYTQKEKFLIHLVKLGTDLGKPYRALSILAKLIHQNKLNPIYIRIPEGEWVNGQYMLVESASEQEEDLPHPPSGGVGGEALSAPVTVTIQEKEEKSMVTLSGLESMADLVPDFDQIEDQVEPRPKEEARFTKINDRIAVMLISRVGKQKEFTLANIVLFVQGKGLSVNNRLNRSMRDLTGKYISLEINIPKEDYELVYQTALKLYAEGKVYKFESFDEVKSFIKNKKNGKEVAR